MRIFILSFILVMLTVSCSYKTKEAVYNMMHERERQECLKQGRSDCPRIEPYDKYKQQREEIIQFQNKE